MSTDFDAIARSEAVRLFVTRAETARPDFRLDATNAADVARLCRSLDGIPLAIELAAAQVHLLSIRDLWGHVEDHGAPASLGRLRQAARHGSLRAVFESSYALLSPSEQTLLRCLTVFRDGWSLDAVGAVCGLGDGPEGAGVVGLLAGLASKSLVISEPGTEGHRYRLLRTIRQFARAEILDLEEAEALRQRFLAWCVELAEQADAGLKGSEQARWLERLSWENENLHKALELCSERESDVGTGLQLATALISYWQLRGRPSEGRRWLSAMLDRADASQIAPHRAKALDGAGKLAFQQGDHATAERLHAESLTIYECSGDRKGVATVLRNLGNVSDAQGDYPGAAERYRRSLRIWNELEDSWGIAATLNNLGLVSMRQGDLEVARRHFEDCLVRFRALGTDWAIGVVLSNLGEVAVTAGDTSAAKRSYEESLDIARRLDDRDGMTYALTVLGDMALREGDVATARAHLEESTRYLGDLASGLQEVEWLESSARLVAAEERPVDAVRLLAAAAAIRDGIEAPLPPKDVPRHEALLEDLRRMLPEEEFVGAWERGSSMAWEVAALVVAGPDTG